MNIAYNMDCMEYMRILPDKAFDLAVVDPPYFLDQKKGDITGAKKAKLESTEIIRFRQIGKSLALITLPSW